MFGIRSISAKKGTGPLVNTEIYQGATYTGNGGTLAVVNNLNMSSGNHFLWLKRRTSTTPHIWVDTELLNSYSTTAVLSPNLGSYVGAYSSYSSVTSGNSNGFTLGTGTATNVSGQTYMSYAFKEAPGFLDIVTYTGNGSTQAIPHNLGTTPGMIIVHKVGNTGDTTRKPKVWHQDTTNGCYDFTSSAVITSASNFGNNSTLVNPSNTHFTVGSGAHVNHNGWSHRAYVFGHDVSSSGVIQCGQIAAIPGVTRTVTLGWQPRFVLIKTELGGYPWAIYDSTRGVGTTTKVFTPAVASEDSFSNEINFISTGFQIAGTPPSGYLNISETDMIYMAIR